ncbi:hypothetical protein D0T51_06210 [Parabacteroides sp. 52]|uniref:site-specific integrase n=1 Tax=unclassified Parabacteroides TaxID=2649774 RepID=UPI0013D1A0E4|nr:MULTISPECIES: site-specific integrase [unclassified Parabacteroides]MDH6534293.1 site-specific recombinase XerD [Parabacteroides sp. PM5-20]NDV55324.1 hypothetical protein [Parabacteroides sp. 52]
MTSIEFHLRTSSRGRKHLGSIFLRVIHDRRTASITLPYKLYPDEWDSKEHQVLYMPDNISRFRKLQRIETDLDDIRAFLLNYAERLEQEGREFYSTDIIAAYRRRHGENLLAVFVEKLCTELTRANQERTARAYQTATKSLVAFAGKRTLHLKDINGMLIRRYEYDLRRRGKTMNTISFYMRNLRSIYNKAIKEGLLEPMIVNPFGDVFTGVQPTQKRALTKEEMKLLAPLTTHTSSFDPTEEDWCEDPSVREFYRQKKRLSRKYILKGGVEGAVLDGLVMAQSLFLFSFLSRGMSFVDMAYLKKTDIHDGVIHYFRKKTRQMLEVKITPIMNQIIKNFEQDTKDTPYVFPIIREKGKPARLQYESGLRLQNKRLKQLAGICGIRKKLSTHVARHTWATVAKGEHLPLSVISEGLGHTSEKTTAIYLASFDRSIIDRAGEKVAKAIKYVG